MVARTFNVGAVARACKPSRLRLSAPNRACGSARRRDLRVTLPAPIDLDSIVLKTRAIALCALLTLGIAPAVASSFGGTTAGASSAGTSGSSGSTSGDDKLVLDARADAASFVASDGRIRGAQLEAALRQLRERRPQARNASDMELARAILAQ
jgi:uncharacterized protein (TIGR02448 family)